MFVIRNVKESDFNDLHLLSQLFVFINLPNDPQLLRRKITKAIETFNKPSKNLEDNYYIFVLEDLTTKKVIGASMIHGKHGTEKEPHYYLKVGQEHKFSKSINTGFIHGTLNLGLETDGYTEIGGLVLDPGYRGNKSKLGKQLSFSRFLFIANHLDQFTDFIHCELMPPFDQHGNSPLWEAIGRRFMNMHYHEADILSRENKEFILNLFPNDTVYETLLPPEARNAIGKVGEETKPVQRMLESIGFYYTDEVDPFDGGPHYRAKKSEIKPIKRQFSGKISFLNDNESHDDLDFIMLNISSDPKQFYAVSTYGKVSNSSVFIPSNLTDEIDLTEGQLVTGIYL